MSDVVRLPSGWSIAEWEEHMLAFERYGYVEYQTTIGSPAAHGFVYNTAATGAPVAVFWGRRGGESEKYQFPHVTVVRHRPRLPFPRFTPYIEFRTRLRLPVPQMVYYGRRTSGGASLMFAPVGKYHWVAEARGNFSRVEVQRGDDVYAEEFSRH